jgi:putative oxidoreductase
VPHYFKLESVLKAQIDSREVAMIAKLIRKSLSTSAPGATILIRIIVGWVFLSEGVQKFLLPEALGAGRFAQIGIPAPAVMGPFVGVVEIVCGALLIAGLFTRLAAIVLLINISVAILSTKLPILLERGYWIFSLPKVSRYGFWSMMHEARTDFAMWMGLAFLLIVGAGCISLDALAIRGKKSERDSAGSN